MALASAWVSPFVADECDVLHTLEVTGVTARAQVACYNRSVRCREEDTSAAGGIARKGGDRVKKVKRLGFVLMIVMVAGLLFFPLGPLPGWGGWDPQPLGYTWS